MTLTEPDEEEGPDTTDPKVGALVDDGDLPGALRALDRSLGGIAYRMDRKFVRNLVVMAVGVVFGLVAIATAMFSARAADQADDRAGRAAQALTAYKAEIVEARIGTCEQYNREQDLQIKAEITQSHDLVNALAQGRPPGPDRDADVKAYNDAHDKIIRSGHPHRDCSPEGIRRYLEGSRK